MGKRGRRNQSWYTQTLTPLMEGPIDPLMQEEGNKKERSWEVIREQFQTQNKVLSLSSSPTNNYIHGNGSNINIPPTPKTHDLRLLLGVLGWPLAPIPLLNHPIHHIRLKDIPVGLDPKTAASLFAKAQCLGEKRIGDEDYFVLKVCAYHEAVMERNEGPAEVMKHVSYGYFSQKSGLLIYLEDSHLTRVQTQKENDCGCAYRETTIRSSIEDYRDVDGVMIAHQRRSIATVFRFGELSMQHSRRRMEEFWSIDDVFNVQGLSIIDSFTPPDRFDPQLINNNTNFINT